MNIDNAFVIIGLLIVCVLVAAVWMEAIKADGAETAVYTEGNTLIVQGRDLEYREAAELLLDNERLRSRVEWLENLLGRVAADLEVIQSYIKVTTPE